MDSFVPLLTGYIRVFQIAVAAISIGLNAQSVILVPDNSTITVKPQTLSIATSSYTALSHALLSGISPRLLSIGQVGLVSKPRSITSFSSSIVSFSEGLYTSGLTGSELSQFLLWFSTFTYQTTSYGSWDCQDANMLVSQYNVTNINNSWTGVNVPLNNYNGLNWTEILSNGEGNTNNSDVNSFLGILANLTIDNGVSDLSAAMVSSSSSSSNTNTNTGANLSVGNFNETEDLLKSNLIIKLSQDCQLKKASIGMNSLGLILFFISTGTVTSSLIQFYNKTTGIALNDEKRRRILASRSKDKNCNHGSSFIPPLNDIQVDPNHINHINKSTYSILSTFAHLKPAIDIDQHSTEKIITDPITQAKTIELNTLISKNPLITLTTVTELEKIDINNENTETEIQQSYQTSESLEDGNGFRKVKEINKDLCNCHDLEDGDNSKGLFYRLRFSEAILFPYVENSED